MRTYHRETRIDAPFEEVWAFHSTVDGLMALTPGFMNLSVDSVVGPDGDPDPGVLEVGSRIEMTTRPFGVGPRTRWVSAITERTEREAAAMFRDVMESGPFPEWTHTHRFFADDGGTIISDRVEYRPPGGVLGETVAPLGRLGLEAMFRHRHRRTKQLLEGQRHETSR